MLNHSASILRIAVFFAIIRRGYPTVIIATSIGNVTNPISMHLPNEKMADASDSYIGTVNALDLVYEPLMA